MVITCSRFLGCYALLTGILTLLTGCPGAGDRIRFDETANVYTVGNDVCFSVSSAKGYRLYDIAINARRTPTKDKKYILNPALIITDGRFCIPPSFYRFENNGEFLVEYLLVYGTNNDAGEARKVVAAVGMKNKRAYNLPLADTEISRQSGE